MYRIACNGVSCYLCSFKFAGKIMPLVLIFSQSNPPNRRYIFDYFKYGQAAVNVGKLETVTVIPRKILNKYKLMHVYSEGSMRNLSIFCFPSRVCIRSAGPKLIHIFTQNLSLIIKISSQTRYYFHYTRSIVEVQSTNYLQCFIVVFPKLWLYSGSF